MRILLCFALCLVLGVAARAEQPPVTIAHRADPGVIEVQGIDEGNLVALAKARWAADEWQALLSVKLLKGTAEEQRARLNMLGTYQVRDKVLEFTPRFPLEPGLTYEVLFHPAKLPQAGKGEPVSTRIAIPARKPGPPAFVERVYPTKNELPENQLKFYIHFSAPMTQGRVYRHLRMLNAEGKAIESPFLELDEELWNRESTRFTLYLDPGRVKKGLRPREDLGPVLEAGKKYTLEIASQWTDAHGQEMKESFRKTFTVGKPDETCPDMDKWKLAVPAAGKATPLEVTFNESLENALARRMLWVADAKGNKIPGTVTLEKEETVWKFTPDKPWPAGDYRLEADSELEDLAGNNFAQPFEVDEQKPIEKIIKQKIVHRAFTVR